MAPERQLGHVFFLCSNEAHKRKHEAKRNWHWPKGYDVHVNNDGVPLFFTGVIMKPFPSYFRLVEASLAAIEEEPGEGRGVDENAEKHRHGKADRGDRHVLLTGGVRRFSLPNSFSALRN